MRSLELFSGAGGLALGIHQAGFRHLAVVEYNRDACATLRLNVGPSSMSQLDWLIKEIDVATFDYAPYRPSAHHPPIDLLAAGTPCQPWSLGGRHKGQHDRRNLFPEVFRAIRELRPRAVFLENVRGLLRKDFRPYFEYILDQLRFPFVVSIPGETWESHAARLSILRQEAHTIPNDEQYDVAYQLYDMADLGVPQQRQRVFIVAFNKMLNVDWQFPKPTHSYETLLYEQYITGTYWDEHGLDQPPLPHALRTTIRRLALLPIRPSTLRWHTVRDAFRHPAPLTEPIEYDSAPPIDGHSGIPGARIYPGHTGSTWDWPAKTIKAGDHGNPGGENMLRRNDGSVRYFTVRELARLQTFPDEWRFANSWTESRRQLGNAVPVAAARYIAQHIRAKLEQAVFAINTSLDKNESVVAC